MAVQCLLRDASDCSSRVWVVISLRERVDNGKQAPLITAIRSSSNHFPCYIIRFMFLSGIPSPRLHGRTFGNKWFEYLLLLCSEIIAMEGAFSKLLKI